MIAPTADEFRARIGQSFTLRDTGVSLELVQVDEHGDQAFSVVFRGPREPLLPQSIYTFERDGDEPVAYFVVPIGSELGDAMDYEAVFSATSAR